MAGYGNRTAPDCTASSLADEHSSTRLGLTDSHSPPFFPCRVPHRSNNALAAQTPTYGAGLGNKHASQPSISPSTSTSTDTEASAEPLRFNTQSTHGSAPYSNAHTYGSASTAGAGWGNKTGSFSKQPDSTLGKLMQKVGAAVHSPGLERKGRAKRDCAVDAQADGEGEGGGLPSAN
ncbi:hypothetical protein SVAN01_08099 [Stagonosporopsis vannaccii]|nr:hypothetical protein SVAN01_08099 [Stagonosporopsis vannaccii]